MKLCFIFTLLFSVTSMARFHAPIAPVVRDGHSVGNGGGVICIKGKCQTLIEAGLKLSPEYDGVWIPDASHFADVENIITRNTILPNSIQEKIYLQIFGRSDHFRRVEIVDPSKLEAIKKQYQEVAEEADFKLDPETFAVVAFSSDDTVTPAMTYLLPGFFQLEGRQQANLLIHEGLYRGKPSTYLKYVLQFESSISQFEEMRPNYTEPCSISSPNFLKVCNNQQFLSYNLGIMSKGEIIATIISLSAHNISKRSTEDIDFVPIERIGKFENETLTIDPSQILSFAKSEPRIPYFFSKVQTIAFTSSGSDSFKTDEAPGGVSLMINWEKSNSGMISDCEMWPRNSYRSCKIYVIEDESSIPLLLPQ